MRSESLAYFLEIAESGSFTHAAKKLYVSQQGLSKSIKALEKDLGCRLFHREGSQLKLTNAGSALIPYAKRCLQDVEMLRQAMEPFSPMASPRRKAAKAKMVTLHATAFVSDSLLSLLQDDLEKAGLASVHVIEHSYEEIITELIGGATTNLFALCLPEHALDEFMAIPHGVFRPLFITEIILAGSSQFVHPDKGAFSLRRVAKLPIVYYNDPLLNDIIQNMFSNEPLEDVRAHSSSLARLSQTIQQGKAVTFSDSLSAYLAAPDDKMAYAPIEQAARFIMGFAYLDNAPVPEQALEYLNAFSDCFRLRCAPYLDAHPIPPTIPVSGGRG